MKKKVYLSGGMADISFEESNEWRKYVAEKLGDCADVFNPNDYYNYDHPEWFDSEREVMIFDLHHLRDSKLVIVNFNVPKSVGTAQELALAYEWCIPIIGLNIDNNEIHPWLEYECTKVFTDIDELVDYVRVYYLGGM